MRRPVSGKPSEPTCKHAQQSSRPPLPQKQRPALPEQCFHDVALRASSSSQAVHVDLIVLVVCRNSSDEPFFSDWERAGEAMSRDWAAPASSSLRATAPIGGRHASGTLYIIFLIAMQCSLKYFAGRYLRDTDKLSFRFRHCSWAMTGLSFGCKIKRT
jgi:hypothetical protein